MLKRTARPCEVDNLFVGHDLLELFSRLVKREPRGENVVDLIDALRKSIGGAKAAKDSKPAKKSAEKLEAAQQYFFAYLSVHTPSAKEEDVLANMNSAPLFWRTTRYAMVLAAFVTLGRIFDRD